MATELEYKTKFAEHIADGIQPLDAAMDIFKGDNVTAGFLMKISKEWPNDAEVRKIVDEITANVPSKLRHISYLTKMMKKYEGTKEGTEYAKQLAQVSGWMGTSANTKPGSADGRDKLAELASMIPSLRPNG